MKKPAKKKKLRKPSAPRHEIGFNGADLVRAVEGFVEHVRQGTVHTLRTTVIELPEPVPARTKAQVRAVREKMGLSQAAFARVLNVPTKTAISWESGAHKPSGAALKRLDIADRKPEALLS